MEIVIDKSYLQGASSEEVRLLCNNYTALFTETLFYELLTAPKAERDACFAKLPVRDNPVALIPRTGPLFRHEVENRRAASPVLEHRLNFTFRFNPRLKRRTFHHSQKEQATLAEWRREVDREVATFHEVATGVSSWCPALKACPGNARKSACKDLKRQACIDTEVIRKVYQSIKPDGFPALLFSILPGSCFVGFRPTFSSPSTTLGVTDSLGFPTFQNASNTTFTTSNMCFTEHSAVPLPQGTTTSPPISRSHVPKGYWSDDRTYWMLPFISMNLRLPLRSALEYSLTFFSVKTPSTRQVFLLKAI